MATLRHHPAIHHARYTRVALRSVVVIKGLLCLLLINSAQAQWAFSLDLLNEAVAVDEAGDVLWTGEFSGILDAFGAVHMTGTLRNTTDFEPGPGTAELAVSVKAAALPAGLYLVRARGEGFSATQKALLVR